MATFNAAPEILAVRQGPTSLTINHPPNQKPSKERSFDVLIGVLILMQFAVVKDTSGQNGSLVHSFFTDLDPDFSCTGQMVGRVYGIMWLSVWLMSVLLYEQSGP